MYLEDPFGNKTYTGTDASSYSTAGGSTLDFDACRHGWALTRCRHGDGISTGSTETLRTETVGLFHFEKVLSELSNTMGRHITAHLLINRTHPNRKNFDDIDQFLTKAKHLTRLQNVLPFRKQIPTAMKQGLGVVEHKKTKYSDAMRDIKRVANEILDITKTH